MIGREFCTTREAAKVLGVSLRTAQLWVENGTLEAWKTEGGHRRIKPDSVERLLAEKSQQGASGGELLRIPPPNVGELKVLIVEDDNTLLKLYRIHFESWGLPINITTAANGYDGLILVGREQPDLMITDLRMPGMDGFQMVRALTASSFREGLEIVVVTGLEDDEIVGLGGLPASIRVFHKPIPFMELKSLAESMIARRLQLAA